MSTSKTKVKTQKKAIVKQPGKTVADLKAEAFVRELEANAYNQTKAYRLAIATKPISDAVAASKGSQMVRREKVQALLAGTAEKAKKALERLVDDNDDNSHFPAVKLALAYEYGTPVSKSENVNVNVSIEDILGSS